MHSTWDTCLLQLAVGPDVLGAVSDLLSSVTTAKKQKWVTTNPSGLGDQVIRYCGSCQHEILR